MKGASLVLFVDDNGEVIHALNVDKDNGQILTTEIKYHPAENPDKKIVGGKLKTRLVYPNSCCWVKTPTGWQCKACP